MAFQEIPFFLCETDYRFFLFKIALNKAKYSIETITYCIMPNHFHLLLRTKADRTNISAFMKSIQHSYAFYFNKKYRHSGHVFQGPFCHKPIRDDDYLRQVIKYIAENPVRKKLVAKAEQWPYGH